ncbi:MAG: hypothetical protein FGM39_09120 [Phycisphaerales bacterium]|nr:hypothetical protein [Phycisphaerales bacterium]
MHRLAVTLWAILAVAAGTGCIPVFTPLVLQDVTTGEKLRSIHSVKHEWDSRPGALRPEVLAHTAARCDEFRALLLSRPPVMEATVHAPESTTPEGYGIFNPGMFNPVDRERTDLRRARDAGLLTAAECTELEATLDAQARRSLVRRAFETADVGVAGSMYFSLLGSGYEPWSSRDPLRPSQELTDARIRQLDTREAMVRAGRSAAALAWFDECTRDLAEPSIPPGEYVGEPAVFRIQARPPVAP